MTRTVTGVAIHDLTMEQAVRQGLALLEEPGPHWIFTPNPRLLSMAARDDQLRRILNGAALSLPDGMGVLLAARLTGRPIARRVTGVDYALALARQAGEQGRRLYLLGAKPGVAQAAGESLLRLCPGLVLAGAADGYFADPARAAEEVRRAGADLVFVCLGCPRQEHWIAQYGAQTGARLLLGLGGTLDVLAGQVSRAPLTWQRLGLEWLWRTLREPRRALDLWRIPLFLGQAVIWEEKEKRELWQEN